MKILLTVLAVSLVVAAVVAAAPDIARYVRISTM